MCTEFWWLFLLGSEYFEAGGDERITLRLPLWRCIVKVGHG